jgi:acyl-CoA synthetase (NDP forming)
MTQNPLHKILSPESVAVAGASNTPAKMGTILYLNLIHGGFNGEVLAVHPNQENIFGKKFMRLPKNSLTLLIW